MNMEIDKDLVRRRLGLAKPDCGRAKRALSRAHGHSHIRTYAYICFVLAVATIVVAIAIGGYNPR